MFGCNFKFVIFEKQDVIKILSNESKSFST